MKYYTAEEAAKKLKVSTGHVYELVKRGEIKKKEGLGRTIRIPSSELKNTNNARNYFTYNEDLVEVIETHLGKVRKLKVKDEYVTSDLSKLLGLNDSYSILRRVDENTYRKIDAKESYEVGIFSNNGITLINYKGIVEYSKRSRSRNIIDFDRLLNELKVTGYEQVEFREEKETNQLINMFEGHKVETITENEKVLFELYSTGKALGYARWNGKRTSCTPQKERIDKVVKNADIEPVFHGGKPYLTEEMLYDFMLEAKTEKCKPFRKWVTNEVLPTIRKTGGYVDNSNKFVDNYFSNLSLEVKQAIKQELVNRNKELVNKKRQLVAEAQGLKREYDINNKTIEQLNI